MRKVRSFFCCLRLWMGLMVLSLAVQLPAQDAVVPTGDDSYYQYLYLEALRQQESDNHDAAFDLLSTCLTLRPDAAELYYLLASYYAVFDSNKCLEFMQRAAALDPSDHHYLERLGQSYIHARDVQSAIDTYERLYEVNRKRSDVLQVLLRLYGYNSDYAGVVRTLDRIETIEGDGEETALAKMQAYAQMGNQKAEYQVLQSLADKHPNDLNYRVMMGNWLLRHEREKEAYKIYRQVLKKEPDHVEAHLSLYDYYGEKGMYDQQRLTAERLMLNPSTPTENKITLMRQVIQSNERAHGDSTEVLSLFHRAMAMPQKNADLAELCAAYMELKKMPREQVDSMLRCVLKIEPDNAPMRLHLIQRVWGTGDYDEVIRLCQPALKYNPDEMAFYYFLGLAHYQHDEQDEALDALRRGVSQINSESNSELVSDFYAIMGDILHQKGMNTEAFEAYDSCLHWKADNISCLNNYAYYLSVEGKDLSRAEQMSYRTILAEPENATYLDTYAWVLFRQGRYAEAREYMDRTLAADTMPSATLYDHAGDIYYHIGQTDKAVDFWQKAVEQDADALIEEKIRKRKYIER